MELKLAFIGLGNVARAFARMLEARRSTLEQEYGINWRVTAIATGRHGCVLATNGIDLNKAVAAVERGEALSALPGQFLIKDVVLLGAALWTLGESLGAIRSEAK